MTKNEVLAAELAKRVIEALRAAEIALVDLHACDDPKCHDDNCVQALSKVRAVLAEVLRGEADA